MVALEYYAYIMCMTYLRRNMSAKQWQAQNRAVLNELCKRSVNNSAVTCLEIADVSGYPVQDVMMSLRLLVRLGYAARVGRKSLVLACMPTTTGRSMCERPL